MPEYLVDTWYFIARSDRFDSYYHAAQRIHARLRGSYVTHYGVLTELLAYFSGYGELVRVRAARSVHDVLRDFTVLPLDRELFNRALGLYEERRDKEYSLVDCMSMVIMRERGITTVLTNDHHFAQEGFTLLNA
jgi:predicted nucleic acid-binding protein